jgi:hypothetical protein
MPRRPSKTGSQGSVAELSRIGNLGCIRFPKSLRAAAGVKRGDRLLVEVLRPGAIRLEKIELPAGEDLPPGLPETLSVDACACAAPPAGCRGRAAQLVTVGWSYVQLSRELALALGFEPDAPIELVAEPSAISVRLHQETEGDGPIGHVTCPP